MPGHHRFRRVGRTCFQIALLGIGSATTVSAQVAPTQEPAAPGASTAPATAFPGPAVPIPVASSSTMTQAQLEAEIRQLRAMVNQLSNQIKQGTSPSGPPAASPPAGGAAAPKPASAPGQSMPANPPASARFNMPATLDNVKANAKFGPGFEVRSVDDEFILQFHNLTQFDYRGYEQGGQTPVRDSFLLPRQWWMFSGRITKPFGYFVSFANAFDNFSILDVFVDTDLDPRLRIRAGRFKTPFTYEFYVEPVQGMAVAERSLFFNNFGQNRDLGIMPYGRLFDNKLDYAAGIFNGNRNGFVANQDGKFFTGFLNYRPFGDEENTLLENLNIGGSVYTGNNSQPTVPQTFRTIVPTTGNAVVGVPFLGLNNNVRESGPMTFWDLHIAYFYRQLALLGEYGGGYQNYAFANSLNFRSQIPVQSFYVQASYLLTGETRSSLGIVKPLCPLNFGRGKGVSGTGAIEPFLRYEYLDIGKQVFADGFADPNLWTNRLFSTHVGLNWHLTQYVKMYFDWNHSEFAEPVVFAPGRRQKTSDLFLIRFQLYF